MASIRSAISRGASAHDAETDPMDENPPTLTSSATVSASVRAESRRVRRLTSRVAGARRSTGTGDRRAAGLPLVGLLIDLVRDRLQPGGGIAAVGEVLQHGQVAHEGVGGSAVPVLLIRRADHGVAG